MTLRQEINGLIYGFSFFFASCQSIILKLYFPALIIQHVPTQIGTECYVET